MMGNLKVSSNEVAYCLKELEMNKKIIEPKVNFFVYVLWDGEEIVYTGQSTRVEIRIEDHKKNKIFDSYSIYKCRDSEHMDELESELIIFKQPKYNVMLGKTYVSINKVREKIRSISEKNKYNQNFYINKIKRKIIESGIENYYFNGIMCVRKSDVKKVINYILEAEHD